MSSFKLEFSVSDAAVERLMDSFDKIVSPPKLVSKSVPRKSMYTFVPRRTNRSDDFDLPEFTAENLDRFRCPPCERGESHTEHMHKTELRRVDENYISCPVGEPCDHRVTESSDRVEVSVCPFASLFGTFGYTQCPFAAVDAEIIYMLWPLVSLYLVDFLRSRGFEQGEKFIKVMVDYAKLCTRSALAHLDVGAMVHPHQCYLLFAKLSDYNPADKAKYLNVQHNIDEYLAMLRDLLEISMPYRSLDNNPVMLAIARYLGCYPDKLTKISDIQLLTELASYFVGLMMAGPTNPPVVPTCSEESTTSSQDNKVEITDEHETDSEEDVEVEPQSSASKPISISNGDLSTAPFVADAALFTNLYGMSPEETEQMARQVQESMRTYQPLMNSLFSMLMAPQTSGSDDVVSQNEVIRSAFNETMSSDKGKEPEE
jgi:hypothetical protein